MVSLFDQCERMIMERSKTIDFVDMLFAYEIDSDVENSEVSFGATHTPPKSLKKVMAQTMPAYPKLKVKSNTIQTRRLYYDTKQKEYEKEAQQKLYERERRSQEQKIEQELNYMIPYGQKIKQRRIASTQSVMKVYGGGSTHSSQESLGHYNRKQTGGQISSRLKTSPIRRSLEDTGLFTTPIINQKKQTQSITSVYGKRSNKFQKLQSMAVVRNMKDQGINLSQILQSQSSVEGIMQILRSQQSQEINQIKSQNSTIINSTSREKKVKPYRCKISEIVRPYSFSQKDIKH